MGAPSADVGVSLEVKSIALTKITPGPIVSRIDANSGLTYRFGSGFQYQGTGYRDASGVAQPPIVQPGIVVNGVSYRPTATDQISRFDANGMTNLIFNERTPDSPTEVNRFLIRGAPEPLAQDAATPGSGVKFMDCSTCVFNVRARLTQPLTNAGIAQSLRIVVKDREGNDTGAGKGADEWDYNLDLHQFNTSTMTTFSLPLSSFTRNMTSTAAGPPVGFDNFGDGSLSNFGLYEFGGLIPAGGGLLKLEMEYMEIRLPPTGVPGDYNGNGVVDMADYVLWRNGGPLQNEVNTPGVVDASDYTYWRSRFGATTGSGSAFGGAAVPEPATWLLMSFAIILLGSRRRVTK
jgi:hypothetical protein